ncbi:RHS repeat-associated core domain-containing protein [Rhabdothermincola sp.]|uniref:RHS repeat-associated core domain-containing protein n=1 Tax=Rhabdothermincola sp. TaxID=2820405 RepID=UPI002FE17BC0
MTDTVLVPVDESGRVSVAVAGAASDVVIDVSAWYVPTLTTWSYTYDGDGLRRTKTSPSGTTSFVWSQAEGLAMLLTETSDQHSTYYLYGPGGLPVEQINPDGSVWWYHHDQLGSTISVTDTAHGRVAEYTYDPYGRPATVVAPPPDGRVAFGYAGQYTDPETGYQYLRARFYDPATGQFLSRDPLTPLTREPYSYTGGNPLNAADPSGLMCWNPTDRDCLAEWGDNLMPDDIPGAATDAIRASGADVGLRTASAATGLSLGICAGGNVFGGYDLFGSICYMATPDGRSGFVEQHGFGGGAPAGINGLLGLSVSNAQCESDFVTQGGASGWLGAGEGPFAGGLSGSVSNNSKAKRSGKERWHGLPACLLRYPSLVEVELSGVALTGGGASGDPAVIPRWFSVGAHVGAVHGGGSLYVGTGQLVLRPGCLTARSGTSEIRHASGHVEVLRARLLPPWMSVRVVVAGKDDVAIASLPCTSWPALRSALTEAGFVIEERRVWVDTGESRVRPWP